MQNLPTELSSQILSYCSKADAASVRLASKALAELCASSLFKHVRLCCFDYSLSSLAAIAHSPHARHVKHITVYSNQLSTLGRDHFEDRMTYGIFSGLATPQTRGYHVPPSQWARAWVTYRRYATEQYGFWSDISRRTILRQSFSSLPNLEKVCITQFHRDDEIQALRHLQPAWDSSTPTLSLIMKMAYLLGAGIGSVMDDWVLAAVLDAVGSRAASTAAISQLRTLDITATSWNSFLTADRLSPAAVHEFDKRRADVLLAIRNVLEINLHIEQSPEGDKRLRDQELSELLQACLVVRKVSIGTSDSGYPLPDSSLQENAAISPLFAKGPSVWPKLEELSIVTNFFAADLLCLMQSHAPTLRSLTIFECCLDDTKALLQAIPSILTGLQHIQLQTLYDWHGPNDGSSYFPDGLDATPAAKQWLLSGEGELPDFRPSFSAAELDDQSFT